jgi:hypothetical protein
MKTTKHSQGNNLTVGKPCLFDYNQVKDHQSHLLRLKRMKGLILLNNPPPKTFEHLVHGTRHVPTKSLKHEIQETSRENLVLIKKMNDIIANPGPLNPEVIMDPKKQPRPPSAQSLNRISRIKFYQ